MTKAYSTDPRKLPRIAIGSRREPNRVLVIVAHDPFWNKPGAPRVNYPANKVLGQAWLASRGPWLAVLHHDLRMGEQPHYELLRLVPVRGPAWGQKPLDVIRDCAREEAARIEREWNEQGQKPTDEQRFRTFEFTGRMSP